MTLIFIMILKLEDVNSSGESLKRNVYSNRPPGSWCFKPAFTN